MRRHSERLADRARALARALRAPRVLDVSTEIDAPPERVWAILTDLSRFREWNPFIREARGEPREGAQVWVHVEPSLGVPLFFHPTVLASDPGRVLRWRGSFLASWLARGEHSFTIEPRGPTGARFTQREVFGGLLPRLAGGLVEREARRGFVDMNRALKARAEAP